MEASAALCAQRSRNARLVPQTYRGREPNVCRVISDQQPEWVHAYRRAVGSRLRARREHQNVTQIGLCLAVGVDRTTYQRWESGLSDPHLGELALLAAELETTVAELVCVDTPWPPLRG